MWTRVNSNFMVLDACWQRLYGSGRVFRVTTKMAICIFFMRCFSYRNFPQGWEKWQEVFHWLPSSYEIHRIIQFPFWMIRRCNLASMTNGDGASEIYSSANKEHVRARTLLLPDSNITHLAILWHVSSIYWYIGNTYNINGRFT